MPRKSVSVSNISAADQEALRRIVGVKPRWDGVVRIGNVAPHDGPCLFHAGPAFAGVDEIPAPVRNSLGFGCLYEGWAKTWEEADALLASGKIAIKPAQGSGLLVPLAGVASPSMAAVRITDPGSARSRYCVLNEGADIATRLGRRDERLLDHHLWLNGDLADWLSGCLADPMDVFPLMLESFSLGDDGHAQTSMGSQLVAAALRRRAFDTPGSVAEFLNGAAAFALNIWMATIALASSAAEGVAESSIVTRAGGNGAKFGYMLAGEAGKWRVLEAPKLVGTVEARFAGSTPTGALGDSAVLDFFGLGGMNLASAPTLATALESHLPKDVLERSDAILAGRHPGFGDRIVACSVDRAVKAGAGPVILLGMIDAEGKAGRLGGGVVDVPSDLFSVRPDAAVAAE
jgi:hypothetical protein